MYKNMGSGGSMVHLNMRTGWHVLYVIESIFDFDFLVLQLEESRQFINKEDHVKSLRYWLRGRREFAFWWGLHVLD